MIRIDSVSPTMISSIESDRIAPLNCSIASMTDCRSYLQNLVEGISGIRIRRVVGTVYSEWPQFESFCERISVSGEAASFLAKVLQFLCYLETLMRQVKMRAVLADESNPAVNPLSYGNATYHNEPLSLTQTNSSWRESTLLA